MFRILLSGADTGFFGGKGNCPVMPPPSEIINGLPCIRACLLWIFYSCKIIYQIKEEKNFNSSKDRFREYVYSTLYTVQYIHCKLYNLWKTVHWLHILCLWCVLYIMQGGVLIHKILIDCWLPIFNSLILTIKDIWLKQLDTDSIKLSHEYINATI